MTFRLVSLVAACATLLLPVAAFAQAPETVAAPSAASRPGPKPGDMAPDFTIVGPDGKEVKLSDFRGKLVLLDIWATWCGPCVASMPHNSGLAEKHAKDGLVILAVCASDTRAAYDGWVKRNSAKYKFQTAFDPAGREGWGQSVFNTQYGVSGFPTLFLIDRDGKIVGSTSGGGPGENPHVTRLLAKGGVPVDTSHLPPEPTGGPKSVPMLGKTAAMPAGVMAPPPKTAAMRVPTAMLGTLKYDDPIPDFAAIGVDGKEVKLSAFKGKPVLISFWTGARSPGDDFAKLAATYKDQGLAVWAINTATERADFDTWAKTNAAALGYSVAWDPAGKAVMESLSYMNFGIGMYPAFMVVNDEGRFRGGLIGMGAKIPAWMRQSLERADLKLTAEDKAAADGVIDAMFAERDKAAAAQGGMVAAGRINAGPPKPAGPPPPATLGAGAIAPDFVMRTVDDKEVRLSDFKDKIVILDFWATWCGPCIASFPHTQEIAKKYQDQGVVVLASGTSDKIAKFKEWIPKNSPKYPDMVWVFDPNERDSATFEERASQKLYHVRGIPTQFVIGRDGKIAATIVGNGGKDDARTEAALASLGVKIDPARIAAGEKQLKAAAEEEADRRAAAEEERKNPKPKFLVSYGKLKQGEPVPDFTAQAADGAAVKFSELTKGKTTVFMVWSARGGLPADMVAFTDGWARRYADQGVLFVGLAAYGARENFDQWRAENAAKISFPVLFDPAGNPPQPPKESLDEMTDDEKKAFRDATRAHYDKIIPMVFAGGVMAPVPNNTVIDAQGRMVGFYVGAGAPAAESLGNLLLRAGVKLTPEDMPAKVFTAEETKEKPPEAKVEMLKIGAAAPDFPATDAAGKPVKLSDYRGKVVVLDFWATWCGPCLASMPHTQEVAAHYKDQGVVVLASCTSDDRKKFETWVKRNQEQYPDILFSHDPQERGPDRASHKLYGVGGIPQQFIIDRDGKVAALVTGYMKGEVLLDDALRKAGIKVADDIPEKAERDRKRRG